MPFSESFSRINSHDQISHMRGKLELAHTPEQRRGLLSQLAEFRRRHEHGHVLRNLSLALAIAAVLSGAHDRQVSADQPDNEASTTQLLTNELDNVAQAESAADQSSSEPDWQQLLDRQKLPLPAPTIAAEPRYDTNGEYLATGDQNKFQLTSTPEGIVLDISTMSSETQQRSGLKFIFYLTQTDYQQNRGITVSIPQSGRLTLNQDNYPELYQLYNQQTGSFDCFLVTVGSLSQDQNGPRLEQIAATDPGPDYPATSDQLSTELSDLAHQQQRHDLVDDLSTNLQSTASQQQGLAHRLSSTLEEANRQQRQQDVADGLSTNLQAASNQRQTADELSDQLAAEAKQQQDLAGQIATAAVNAASAESDSTDSPPLIEPPNPTPYDPARSTNETSSVADHSPITISARQQGNQAWSHYDWLADQQSPEADPPSPAPEEPSPPPAAATPITRWTPFATPPVNPITTPVPRHNESTAQPITTATPHINHEATATATGTPVASPEPLIPGLPEAPPQPNQPSTPSGNGPAAGIIAAGLTAAAGYREFRRRGETQSFSSSPSRQINPNSSALSGHELPRNSAPLRGADPDFDAYASQNAVALLGHTSNPPSEEDRNGLWLYYRLRGNPTKDPRPTTNGHASVTLDPAAAYRTWPRAASRNPQSTEISNGQQSNVASETNAPDQGQPTRVGPPPNEATSSVQDKQHPTHKLTNKPAESSIPSVAPVGQPSPDRHQVHEPQLPSGSLTAIPATTEAHEPQPPQLGSINILPSGETIPLPDGHHSSPSEIDNSKVVTDPPKPLIALSANVTPRRPDTGRPIDPTEAHRQTIVHREQMEKLSRNTSKIVNTLYQAIKSADRSNLNEQLHTLHPNTADTLIQYAEKQDRFGQQGTPIFTHKTSRWLSEQAKKAVPESSPYLSSIQKIRADLQSKVKADWLSLDNTQRVAALAALVTPKGIDQIVEQIERVRQGKAEPPSTPDHNDGEANQSNATASSEDLSDSATSEAANNGIASVSAHERQVNQNWLSEKAETILQPDLDEQTIFRLVQHIYAVRPDLRPYDRPMRIELRLLAKEWPTQDESQREAQLKAFYDKWQNFE